MNQSTGKTPAVVANTFNNTYRTGTLKGVSETSITKMLGFKPNMDDDADKVTASWSFTVDGEQCAVWDYKGSFDFGQASTFGPEAALRKVFGDLVSK